MTGAAIVFPFSLYFFHFRCFNLVTAQNPMFVLGVPIRQKTEVSQQKFVQKHLHQHTFSWFQPVLGKSGHAELVCTATTAVPSSAPSRHQGDNMAASCGRMLRPVPSSRLFLDRPVPATYIITPGRSFRERSLYAMGGTCRPLATNNLSAQPVLRPVNSQKR